MIRVPTEYDARSLLVGAGVWFEDRGHYYSMKCPFHKGGREKEASSALYKKNWWFKCFTCGESMRFSRLYKELRNEAWNEHGEFTLSERTSYVRDCGFGERERVVYEIEAGRITSVYDNAAALSYCRSRDMSDEFIKAFEIQATDLCRFKNHTVWRDRLLIPVKRDGKPYSLEGRDYTRTQKPKCLYPKDSPISIVFNVDNLDKSEPLIVCEGLMDIPKIWSNITKNVTATFGVSLATEQKTFLKDANNVILFIDDDKAGLSSVGLFDGFMEKDFRVARVRGKDPGDATLEETIKALEEAEPYGVFLIDELGMFEQKTIFLLSDLMLE